MSKLFNEMQKASQRVRKLDRSDVDVTSMVDSLKHGRTAGGENEIAEVRLQRFRHVNIGVPGKLPLILRKKKDAEQVALEAYRSLRTRLMFLQATLGLRSIAFTSSVPGEGKTWTVMNLGLCYSQLLDQRVLIVDADLRTCGLSKELGHPDNVGLRDLLTGHTEPQAAILGTNHPNLFMLPAGTRATPSADPTELFTGTAWQEFLDWCRETFTTILVDTPPVLPVADFELISAACDAAAFIIRSGKADLETLQKALGTVDAKKIVGVVLNAAERSKKRYYGYVGHYYGD